MYDSLLNKTLNNNIKLCNTDIFHYAVKINFSDFSRKFFKQQSHQLAVSEQVGTFVTKIV